MGELREIRVPDIGDFKDVPIIEIAVQPGQQVDADAPLITLESDKASMEVPSPAAGVVKSLAVKVGDKVSEGAPILMLEVDGAGPAEQPVKPPCPLHRHRRVRRLASPTSAFPPSAILKTCRSSRSWSSRATPSRRSSRW